MINEFLWPELEDINEDVYFQQDGATYHKSGETIGLLREKFPGPVIMRFNTSRLFSLGLRER